MERTRRRCDVYLTEGDRGRGGWNKGYSRPNDERAAWYYLSRDILEQTLTEQPLIDPNLSNPGSGRVVFSGAADADGRLAAGEAQSVGLPLEILPTGLNTRRQPDSR